MKTEFKNGNVTAYGFACGLVQQKENTYKIVKMYKERNMYFVIVYYIINGVRTENEWNDFHALQKAKQFYNLKTI